jgi:hypothetical protein
MSNYNPKDYGKVKITVNNETVSTMEDINRNLAPDEAEFKKKKGFDK